MTPMTATTPIDVAPTRVPGTCAPSPRTATLAACAAVVMLVVVALPGQVAAQGAQSDVHERDVFEVEPVVPDNPLLGLPNVVLTPHISAGTEDAMKQKMRSLFDNLRRFFASGELANRVTFP